MSLSSRLQTKVNANRAQREALAAKNQSFLNRCFAVGLALGLGGGVLAIVAGMRQVASSAATRVVTPIAAPVAPPEPHNEFHNPSVKGQKCVPYASNGTYLPELCGDHDAFREKAERTARPPATTEAERVKAQALSYAAEKMLERCDRDWLPSTCAEMRAELSGRPQN